MPDGRPNILLIVTDQERAWDTLPAGLRLPARERLRSRGVSFVNYHVNAQACSPSRSAIYTGQHIQRTGVFDNAGGRIGLNPVRTPTIGQMLQVEGYFAVYAGKWHLSAGDSIRRMRDDYADALAPFGFDFYRPLSADGDSYGTTREGAVADRSLASWAGGWLERDADAIAEERPWFLALNFANPHDIMFFDATGRQRATQLTDWAVMAPAPSKHPYAENLGFDLPRSFTDGLSGRPAVHRAFAEDAALAYGDLPHEDEAAWRRYQNYYFNCLRDVDRRIGSVLNALDKTRHGENTVVVFTSDHGELGGAHGLRGKGPVLYRENFAVPLVVRHPDVAAGAESKALFSAVDLAPTILAFTGLGRSQVSQKYPDLAGYDMSGSLTDPGGEGARAASAGGILLNSNLIHACNPLTTAKSVERRRQAEMDPHGAHPTPEWPNDWFDPGLKSFLRGYFDGRFRYGRYFEPCDIHVPVDWNSLIYRNELELYDTAKDPDEIHNLAKSPEKHKTLILELNAKLNALIEVEAGGENCSLPYKPSIFEQEVGV